MTRRHGLSACLAILVLFAGLSWIADCRNTQTQIQCVAKSLDVPPPVRSIDELERAISLRLEKEESLEAVQVLLERVPQAHRLANSGASLVYEFRFGSRYSTDLFGLGFYVHVSDSPEGILVLTRSMPEGIKYW